MTFFWTPQIHLPDQVRSGIVRCLGCRTSWLKTRTLGRDLQNQGNLNPPSPGEMVAGVRVLGSPVRQLQGGSSTGTRAEGTAVATGHGLRSLLWVG